MKTTSIYYLLITVSFLLAGCGTISQLATSKHEPYSSVQKISLLAPIKTNNSIIIPIDLTESEFRFNSGLTIKKITTTTNNESVYFYIVSCVAGGNLSLCGKPNIKIEKPKHQLYTVFYLDPDNTNHEIGKIEITK